MSNINLQNIIRKKNIELMTKKIFDIKLKSNDFNNIILNELNGYQTIFYLKNKKIFQFFLRKKKKQELDILKNHEIIYLTTNLNHNSLICLSNTGCIFSINYETYKIKYFSNLDFNKFIIPNIISTKKRSFSFSQKNSNKNNINNLNYIYNIFCNNTSDKIVLNLNKYILFWYQNNYNIDNNFNHSIDNSNKIESVTGTIYSIIKDNEIEKIDFKKEKNSIKINNNKVDININSGMKEFNIINEGVEAVFNNNYFLGSHTRIFYAILVNINDNNNDINKKNERKLYIFDYLFKFNYKNRFRCIPETPKNDFFYSDLFNSSENEDLNDIKSKISSTNIYFNYNNNDNKNFFLKKNDINNNSNNNNNKLLLKSNYKGNILAIIINDDMNNTNLLNMNSYLIFFMTETYSFSKRKIVNIIGKKILINNPNNIFITNMEWICHDFFLLILTSKGYFFLLNINFQVIYLTEISDLLTLTNFDTYYIPEFFSIKKNENLNLNLYISRQREDLFMISDKNYVVCYQINYKMYEHKLINTEIAQDNFENFLFILKYYQLYITDAQFDYTTQEEIYTTVLDLMSRYLQTLFQKNENNIMPNPGAEIIQTDTGIKIMKTKQNDDEEIKLDENKKDDFDFFKKQNNLLKNDMDNSLYINFIRFIKIFFEMNLLHENNLALFSFIIGKSMDFLIHLMNNKELWLAVLFLNLCEKYLCKNLLLFKNVGEDNLNFNKIRKIPLSEIIFKSKEGNSILNSEKYIPYFFDIFQNYGKAPINKAVYNRMRILLIFFCLIEFRTNSSTNINVLFFILAKIIVEGIKEKESIEELYKVTKIIIKNFKYLKQENDKQGKDEFVLSSLSLSYRNEFFSDFKITKTERDDINFDFLAEFYSIDDFVAYTEPTENFCKHDDLNLVSEFNYLNNTGILQKWVIFMTNYLYYDLFQDIKKFMDNHLRQEKDKTEINTSPEEKSLTKLIFFNMVFILQYLQNFLKDIILFLTQKESCFSDNYNKFNIHMNNIYHMDNNNINDDMSNNNDIDNKNISNNSEENFNEENFIHYSDKIQDDFNRVLFKSISPIDIPYIIFSFYINETNPNNKSKAIDINKELGKKIMSVSRQFSLSMDDLLQLIEFIHFYGFNYIENNNLENNEEISQLEPMKRIQNSIFTSFLFYFFILHKLNLIYLLESELNLLYAVLDSLNMNQRKQLYEIIYIITNGTLKYLLQIQFEQKIKSVESKYMEILLTFDKILFYKMIKEESCFVRKNIADFVKISPSIMSSYLLEGALYYEYKNFNKICKKIVGLDAIILNNIHFNNNNKKKNNNKFSNNISIFEILYGLSGVVNNNINNNNINITYGNDKKMYKHILKILFNNEKIVIKQFLILLNNIIKLLQLKHESNTNGIYSNNDDILIFKLENDHKYIKETINSKISENNNDNNNIDNKEEEISKNIFSIIDLIIKGNFDDRNLFKFNNNEIKNKLVKNLKLIISKLLHLLFEIQIKINLLLFENKNTPQSKINYIYILSQALLCEQNPKIAKKIISDLLIFIKLLNIKKILSMNNPNTAEIKQRLIDIMKNIELSIILNFNAEYEIKKINEILAILGIKLIKLLNYKDIDNLAKILPQITSKKLKNFLLYCGCPITWYYPSIQSLYKNLLNFVINKPTEKYLIKARKQYIKLSDAFFNIIGIPQKSFIEFDINWELVERNQLYQAIVLDDLDEYLYNDNKTKIIMNNRQNTGKETPRKIRKNSVSKFNNKENENNKYKSKNKKNKKNNKIYNINNNNIIINEKDKEKEKDKDNIKYNKSLKIKKIKNKENIDIDKLNISGISNNKIIYLKKTVRKMIFNRFIHNIFLFIEKGKENTFKIYSISDKNKNNKNVEVILLNPIFIV